jgi:hypothetical protein
MKAIFLPKTQKKSLSLKAQYFIIGASSLMIVLCLIFIFLALGQNLASTSAMK